MKFKLIFSQVRSNSLESLAKVPHDERLGYLDDQNPDFGSSDGDDVDLSLLGDDLDALDRVVESDVDDVVLVEEDQVLLRIKKIENIP